MDLPLGQPSGGAVFPRKDILFSSKLAEDRFLAMNRTHALFAIVTAVSVQLCSLLDSSGRLQESSRKHALLQATYLPRRKTVIAHHFNPFCCLGYCTSAWAVKQVFYVRRAYQFFTRLFRIRAKGHPLFAQQPLNARNGPFNPLDEVISGIQLEHRVDALVLVKGLDLLCIFLNYFQNWIAGLGLFVPQ